MNKLQTLVAALKHGDLCKILQDTRYAFPVSLNGEPPCPFLSSMSLEMNSEKNAALVVVQDEAIRMLRNRLENAIDLVPDTFPETIAEGKEILAVTAELEDMK